MYNFNKDQWKEALKGYDGKAVTDERAEKNLDAYVGEVANNTYLPQYSTREDDQDYKDRLERADNSYFNWPKKILKIWKNTIFRFTEAVRETKVPALERFFKNADGAGMELRRFVQDIVFPLHQLTGGCAIVIDKPPKPKGTISKRKQNELGLYPYSYIIRWDRVVNFGHDKQNLLVWVVFYSHTTEDNDKIYRYWDRDSWADVNQEGKAVAKDKHNLGIVPVILSMAEKNPKYDYRAPMSPMDDIVRITLQIFNLCSQLDQIIVYHAFPKLQMSKSMFETLQGQSGATNVYVYADGAEDSNKASYVQTPTTEFDKIIELIYQHLPNMLLEMATVRDKTAVAREESGKAKFMDSTDELANLLEKAESMELVEIQMATLAAAWEKAKPDFTIQYSKEYDIKGTYEQLKEMVDLFKEVEGQFPTFAKESMKRFAKKTLGNIASEKWTRIEAEIEACIDPSLNLSNLNELANSGVVAMRRIARILSAEETENMTDEQVDEWIEKNLNLLRGGQPKELDPKLKDGDEE